MFSLHGSLLQLFVDEFLEEREILGATNNLAVDEKGRRGFHPELFSGLFRGLKDCLAQILSLKAKVELLAVHADLLHDFLKLVPRLRTHPQLLLREEQLQGPKIPIR